MDNKYWEKEFCFFREKMKQIAVEIKDQNYVEAAFMLGCLHSISCNHAQTFQDLVRLEENKKS